MHEALQHASSLQAHLGRESMMQKQRARPRTNEIVRTVKGEYGVPHPEVDTAGNWKYAVVRVAEIAA